MHHYRKTRNVYVERQKADMCPFCDPKTLAKSVKTTKYSYIVPNLTQYDLWELKNVTDHLMVMPLRHTIALNELSPKEQLDIMQVIAEYESRGYNIYARATDSTTRSVPHQHTHLIKTGHKKAFFSFFLHRPYFLVKF